MPRRWALVAWIGLRYLASRRKHGFVSFITWISILGVTVGVTAMIVVLSVMTGLQEDLRDKILGTNAHIVVLRSGGALADWEALAAKVRAVAPDQIVGVTPFIYNQAMLATPANVMGVVLRGVHVPTVTGVTRIGAYVQEGSLAALTAPVPPREEEPGALPLPGIVVGKELAFNMGLFVGDEVNVVVPAGNIGPLGVTPRMKRFRVVGLFHSGMYEYDATLVYVSLRDAQRFFGMGERVTGLEVRVADPDRADEICLRLQAEIGFPHYCRDWKELNRNLFGALQLEKVGMSLILILIVMVAAFNIVSTLFMIVLQKSREIAILKSMGATNGVIRAIFMVEGLVVGLLGAGLGGVLGLILCELLDRYQFISLPKDIYYIDRLPVLVDPLQVGVILAAAVAIALAATLYPAGRAAKVDPVAGIRYGADV